MLLFRLIDDLSERNEIVLSGSRSIVDLPVGFQYLRLVHADVPVTEQTAHAFRKVLVVGTFDDFETILLLEESGKFRAELNLWHIVTVLLT